MGVIAKVSQSTGTLVEPTQDPPAPALFNLQCVEFISISVSLTLNSNSFLLSDAKTFLRI